VYLPSDLVGARRLYEQSLQMKHDLGDMRGIAASLHHYGRPAADEGHLTEALQLFEESFNMFNELQSPNAKIAEGSIARVRERLEKNGSR
jgi:hypothetical protein